MGSIDEKKLHVAMFPWFAFGHINPFVELSNKLSVHDIKISFLSAPGNIPRIRSSLHSPEVDIIPVPIPAVEGLPPGVESTAQMTPHMAELLKKATDSMKPQIKTLLSNLRPHIVFFDFGQHWLPSIASPLNIKTLFFSVFAAIATSYATVPVRLASQTPPTVDDLKLPPPGFPLSSTASLKTYEARDYTYIFKTLDGPSVYDRVIACMTSSSGIVIKTCMEIEGPYVKFIEAQFGKPILLAGPVAPRPPSGELESRWAGWLTRFPEKSVVFCSFGSETFLSDEQIRELVLGLDMAGAPFIVVLNFPVGEDSAARLKAALPEGFEERVKEKGMVHVGWVQQLHILAHVSVGCFVCHSGLSSITEALVNDCQLVLLPQKGDQFLNARLVSGDLKAGVEVKRDEESGHFGKVDLCEAVETVMTRASEEPGKSIRQNHRKWMKFLTEKAKHEKFVEDFVEEMKKMCGK